jgi:hypothetical protein
MIGVVRTLVKCISSQKGKKISLFLQNKANRKNLQWHYRKKQFNLLKFGRFVPDKLSVVLGHNRT